MPFPFNYWPLLKRGTIQVTLEWRKNDLFVYLPRTQITLVLIGRGLVFFFGGGVALQKIGVIGISRYLILICLHFT